MAFKAIKPFGDGADNGFSYGVGTAYPRKRFNPDEARIAFLIEGGYIEEVIEEESVEIEAESVEIAKETEDLTEKTITELKVLLTEKGIEIPAKAKKSDLISLLTNA